MQRGVIAVPTEAVQTGQQGTYVYVVDAKNSAATRAVATGIQVDDHDGDHERLDRRGARRDRRTVEAEPRIARRDRRAQRRRHRDRAARFECPAPDGGASGAGEARQARSLRARVTPMLRKAPDKTVRQALAAVALVRRRPAHRRVAAQRTSRHRSCAVEQTLRRPRRRIQRRPPRRRRVRRHRRAERRPRLLPLARVRRGRQHRRRALGHELLRAVHSPAGDDDPAHGRHSRVRHRYVSPSADQRLARPSTIRPSP